MIAIFRRELRRLAFSHSTWFLIAGFLLLNGFGFMVQLQTFVVTSRTIAQIATPGTFIFNPGDTILRPFFGNLYLSLLLFIPLLTMRGWAEEKQRGELPLLLTYPIGELALVLGKGLATLVFYSLTLILSSLLVLLLRSIHPFNPTIIPYAYLGLFLVGLFLVPLGLFCSLVGRSLFNSALFSFLALFALWVVAVPAPFLPPFPRLFLEEAGVVSHLDPFLQGILESRNFSYFFLGGLFFSLLSLLKLLIREGVEED